ncbi:MULTISPECIES: integrase catalytic domain-containing protein [Bacillus cereus group]|uniref:integrase catalytic domain-containing protein n=1 Tax=Bacillus cereus group TaxID=86661 RepID=UPI0011232E1D|nr:DDE-type integrase/transposase/recombinase [Bacillus cereus]MDA1924757.1 transposase family protein [Bacillus cereus]UDW08151.1 transposase family protein [Bacillus cereus]
MNVLYNNMILEEDTDEDKIYYRILWIDSKQEVMYIISLNISNALPIKVNVLDIINDIQNDIIRVSLSDPYYKLYMDEELNASQRGRIEKNWHLIQRLLSKENIPAIFDSKGRGGILKAYIQQGYTKPTLYKLLRMYWKNGQNKGAIVDNYKNCGGKGKEKKLGRKKIGRPKTNKDIEGEGINITQQVKKNIVNAFQKYYMNQKENSLRYTYERFLADNFMNKLNFDGEIVLKFKEGANPPSYAQFVYWAKKLTSSHQVSIKRLGEKEHNLTQRAILGKSNDYVYGPGSLYQIDSTVADVYVVSSTNYNSIIGRPTLYLVVDVFSRMIVGFHVDTRPASLEMARLSLYCAVSDKVEYCKSLGVSIERGEWIASNLPAALLADRGELMGKEAQRLADRINIRLENTPPYRADLKGIVERALGVLQQSAKPLLPGYVEKNFGKRGAPDYRLSAALTIQDIRKIIIEYIKMYNQKTLEHYELNEAMLRDQVIPTPNNIWRWGIEKCSGILSTYPKEELKFAFMSVDIGKVSGEGIKYKNIRYTCTKAIQEHWFEKARNKRWKIRLLFDPRNMTFMYIKDENTSSYLVCEMDRTSAYYGKSLSEIEYLQKIERELKQNKIKENLERKVTYQSRIEKVVADAEQRTKSTFPIFEESNKEKIKNIRDSRVKDNFERQPQEAFLIKNQEVKEENINERISSLGDEQEEGEFNAYEIEQLKLYEKLMEEEGYEEENG